MEAKFKLIVYAKRGPSFEERYIGDNVLDAGRAWSKRPEVERVEFYSRGDSARWWLMGTYQEGTYTPD